MKKLHENKDGYYLIEGIGNMIYPPDNCTDLVEFIKDYLVDFKGDC